MKKHHLAHKTETELRRVLEFYQRYSVHDLSNYLKKIYTISNDYNLIGPNKEMKDLVQFKTQKIIQKNFKINIKYGSKINAYYYEHDLMLLRSILER